MELKDIVPAYDALHRLVATVSEDDLILTDHLELDVRDAPLQELTLALPAGFTVAALTGRMVDDFSILSADKTKSVRVRFKKAVSGRVLLEIRGELGESPLEKQVPLTNFTVEKARSERGWFVLASGPGVNVAAAKATGLREVHTGALPTAVPDARKAWRFREPGWGLTLSSLRKASGVRAESFHLLSLGEGIAFGSVAVSYYITGAPVDELRFRIPERLGAVEFVGRDVQRWWNKDGLWTVKLNRKVTGDYNLGAFYTTRYNAGQEIL
ncbi:MAG: hypothetical protein ACYTGH_06030, partial [Planctomycetota bacterium]